MQLFAFDNMMEIDVASNQLIAILLKSILLFYWPIPWMYSDLLDEIIHVTLDDRFFFFISKIFLVNNIDF